MTEVKLIRSSTMNYCDIYCDNAMTLRIGGMQQQRNGTRMTQIGRISTDTHYPCASALSVSSVFNRNSLIINEDNKPQMNADERRYFPASEFSKIIHRKEHKVHQMISFGIRKTTESAMNLRYIDEHEKNTELVRTKTNSCGVSSFRVRCVRCVRCYFFSYQGTEDTENKNKTLCSLCSPWLNNLAGKNFSGLNARALEYSIFMQGETIKGGNFA